MIAMSRLPGTVRSMSCSPLRQRGLSLVELMISVTIGLLILAALVALFVNTSGSNREMARANGVIENGRLAIQLLESDIVHAGFWGGLVPEYDNQTADTAAVPTDVPTAVPDPCLAYSTANWNAAYRRNLIGLPVQVYDDASVCSAVVTDKAAGTDVLVVRHLETCVPGEGGNCEADVAGKLYSQATQCLAEAATPYILGTTGTTAFTLHRRNCTDLSDKRKFVSNIYYIRDFAVTAGDGIPTLMRSQFDFDGTTLAHQIPAVAMIEGIEGFRVELGVDDVSETGDPVDYTAPIEWTDPDVRDSAVNRGDGVPDDDFISCTSGTPCTAAQLMNVTAVKLYVLVRSRDESPGYTDTKTYSLGATTMGPYNDRFKRHVFVSTVRLPNISGRRETP